MHELPKELNQSLRSWRGSIYGNSPRREASEHDLEKGPEIYDYGEKQVERTLSPESAVIVHPSASSRSLRQASPQRPGQSRPQDRQYNYQPLATSKHQSLRFGNNNHDASSQQPNPPKPKTAVAKRQGTLPPQTPASQKMSIYHHAPQVSDPDPAADRLDDDPTPLTKEQFYELMGMKHPPEDKEGHPLPGVQLPKDLATRHGLYGKIRSHLSYIQLKYRIFDIFTYVFLALQLLLSAVFIVLGSLTTVDSHIAIAILGAVSTVVAGALALMKGQGLPNRLRQIRDDLSNVVFEAEELYFDVVAERPVYYRDIRKLREDYLRVLQEARTSHPDTFNSAANRIAQGFRAQGKSRPTTATPVALGAAK